MYVLRRAVEDALASQERLVAALQQDAADHMAAGREESAQRCINIAEGLSISALMLRSILEPTLVEAHRLEAV